VVNEEFSPEQQVMVAILAWAGEPDPEGIVRAERIESGRPLPLN
jgi:hypothetical protein